MDTEKSLVAWINTNGLSRKIRGITDLADLRLLYELLTQISTADYCETVFHTHVELISRELNLAAIAEQPTSANMIPLLELVIAMAVKCSSKETYISRMWNLPTSAQEQMMIFIQRILEKIDRSDPTISELLHAFKTDKRLLLADFETLRSELVRTARKLDNAINDRNTLKSSLTEMESDLKRKPGNKTTAEIDSLLRVEYESQIFMKNDQIEELKQAFAKAEAKSAQEVRRLKDELDVQAERIQHLSTIEATAESYKKRLDEHATFKRQIKDLTTAKAELIAQLKRAEEGEAHFSQLQHSFGVLKDQLKNEKDKYATLHFQFTQVESKLSQSESVVMDMKERMTVLTEKVAEYEAEKLPRFSDFGRMSDVSLQKEAIEEYDEKIRRLMTENAALKNARGDKELAKHYSDELDASLLEKEKLKERFAVVRREKDITEAAFAELTMKFDSLQNEFAVVQTAKISLEEQMHAARVEVEDKKAISAELSDLRSKFESLQVMHQTLSSQYASQKSELELSESAHKRVFVTLQALEGECAVLKSDLSHCELKNKQLIEAEQLFKKEIESFKNYKPEMTQLQGETIKLIEVEREVARLRGEVLSMTLSMQDKDGIIGNLTGEQQRAVGDTSRKIEEIKAKHDKELMLVKGKSQEIQQELIVLKAKHKDFLEEWRREQNLVAMVIHNIGLELCQQRFRAGVKT